MKVKKRRLGVEGKTEGDSFQKKGRNFPKIEKNAPSPLDIK